MTDMNDDRHERQPAPPQRHRPQQPAQQQTATTAGIGGTKYPKDGSKGSPCPRNCRSGTP